MRGRFLIQYWPRIYDDLFAEHVSVHNCLVIETYIVEYQSRPSVRQKINHFISVYPKFMKHITNQEYLDKVNNSLIFLRCSNIDLYMTEVASLKLLSNCAQWPKVHTIHWQIDDDLFGSKHCSIRVKWHELNKNMNCAKGSIYSQSRWQFYRFEQLRTRMLKKESLETYINDTSYWVKIGQD